MDEELQGNSKFSFGRRSFGLPKDDADVQQFSIKKLITSQVKMGVMMSWKFR